MRHILLVALLLTTTSLAKAQSNIAVEPKPFHISSRGTAFGVQADFEGTYLIREDYIEVNVTKATIYVSDHCPYKGRSSVNQLRFGLATYNEEGRWKIESSASPIQIGLIMSPKEEVSLGPSYFFTPFFIPKAKDADLTTRWFIIEIQTDAIEYYDYRPGSGFVYASSCRDIFVPKPNQPITPGNGASLQSCQAPKKESGTLGRN
jgi:hypothetical protein